MGKYVLICLTFVTAIAFGQTASGSSAPGPLMPHAAIQAFGAQAAGASASERPNPARRRFAKPVLSIDKDIPHAGRRLRNAVAVIIGNRDYKYAP